jgi:hypothetical protein
VQAGCTWTGKLHNSYFSTSTSCRGPWPVAYSIAKSAALHIFTPIDRLGNRPVTNQFSLLDLSWDLCMFGTSLKVNEDDLC